MKDYYKILGVKENASEEEIRARWIELTKHYHPDLSKGNKSEQKIKEINEAYQTLKFSSNRMEYDLKRNYERKKRRLYIKRISPYGIIFVLLIILCTLLIGKLQVPSLRKLESVTYHLKGAPQTQSNQSIKETR
jgi:DnaJ-domain-containing protein 1